MKQLRNFYSLRNFRFLFDELRIEIKTSEESRRLFCYFCFYHRGIECNILLDLSINKVVTRESFFNWRMHCGLCQECPIQFVMTHSFCWFRCH